MQALNASAAYSPSWRLAERRAREPAHSYMKRRHAVALYAYTKLLQAAQRRPVATGGAAGSRGTRQSLDLRSSSFLADLGEAIRILKHSQVTCLHTALPALALRNLNDSGSLLRFRTFTLGSGGRRLARNASCVLVRTCFGADVSRYSASRRRGQVLIPPYEVFRVVDGAVGRHRCRAVRILEGHRDCVYDADSDSLHSVSADPPDAFWIFGIILGLIGVPLVLPLLGLKLLVCRERSRCAQGSADRPPGGLGGGSDPPQ